MLDILPSMPATLISGHENAYGSRLPRVKEFGHGLENYRRSPNNNAYGSSVGRPPLGPDPSSAIPPSSRQGGRALTVMTSFHPQVAQPAVWPGHTVDSAPLPNQPYPPSKVGTAAHSRSNSRTEPFYNKYYSAKQPHSPAGKKEAVQKEPVNPRRPSTDENLIASHLQIPSSINDSRGSLPEFAAQVWPTCGDPMARLNNTNVTRSPASSGLNPLGRCSMWKKERWSHSESLELLARTQYRPPVSANGLPQPFL